MKYQLEIYTDCKKKDQNGDLLNEHYREFNKIHELAEYIVNLTDDVDIEFNSGEAKDSIYKVWNGNINHRGEVERFLIVSDKKLIDFCMKKYNGSIEINCQPENYFGTKGSNLWKKKGSHVVSEHNYQKTENCAKFKIAKNNKVLENANV